MFPNAAAAYRAIGMGEFLKGSKMRTIHKYPLEMQDNNAAEMPDGAEVLCVQMQNGRPCLWALVDTARPKVTRAFQIYGTGHSMSSARLSYIGTFQLGGGSLVFHLFENLTPRP